MLESFEGPIEAWQLSRDTAGNGAIRPTTAQVDAGAFAAQLTTSASGNRASLSKTFADPSHPWMERPGTFVWQRARIYVPSSTLAQLQSEQYLTLARFEASNPTARWELRIRANGQLAVLGIRHDNSQPIEFGVYATIPADRWIDLEIGLHSQNGPGVKRAFAFLLEGTFYGWYHQGQLKDETYLRATIGIVETTSSGQVSLYVDQWRQQSNQLLPSGPDNRSSEPVQSIDYRLQRGAGWQIDWTTWANDLRLDSTHGLYSAVSRLQSGMNLDKMPDLTSGWAEIEIDWSRGTPPLTPAGYFGPMVGFRKEINREENLEIIPIGNGDGTVDLVFEAWVGSPVIIARWPIPAASISSRSHIPEPGDIIRARWEQAGNTTLRVQAFYYDASAARWFAAIDRTVDISAISNGATTVNYTDGYHSASSLTIDGTQYSIRRFTAGTLATFPDGLSTATPTRTATPTHTATSTGTVTPSRTTLPTQTVTPTRATQSGVRYNLPLVRKP